MEDRQKKIIEILRHADQPVSGKTLAKLLNVSDRTVRNYIKEINAAGKQIISDQKGYVLLSKPLDGQVEPIHSLYNFKSGEDRMLFIGSQFVCKNQAVDLYDLADKIFISYSTIEKDLAKLKILLQEYHLCIQRSHGLVSILGSEQDKRSFIRYVLHHGNTYRAKDLLIQLCDEIALPYEMLRDIVVQELERASLHANDYALNNILTHLIIALYRIQGKNSFDQQLSLNDFDHRKEKQCAQNIFQEICRHCNFSFSENDLDQLTLLLRSKTNRLETLIRKNATISQDRYLSFSRQIVKDIHDQYLIDIDDEDFITFFSLHLKNIIFRCAHNTFNSNPFSDIIYVQNPLIYDIAVFISDKIKNVFGYSLNRDEITFISLHVGAIIERKEEQAPCIVAGLLISQYYYSLDDHLQRLPKNLHIVKITDLPKQLENIPVDLIINATRQSIDTTIPLVRVSPFFDHKDLLRIEKCIETLQHSPKKAAMRALITSFFSPMSFERNHMEKTPEAMIRYMSDQLFKAGIVPEGFGDAVVDRERITPTSFDNKTAMPHAIQCSAHRNRAYVIVNDTPMEWGYFSVNIIILLAVEYTKREQFKKIYSHLIELLDDPIIIDRILKAKTFTEFLECLLSD